MSFTMMRSASELLFVFVTAAVLVVEEEDKEEN